MIGNAHAVSSSRRAWPKSVAPLALGNRILRAAPNNALVKRRRKRSDSDWRSGSMWKSGQLKAWGANGAAQEKVTIASTWA